MNELLQNKNFQSIANDFKFDNEKSKQIATSMLCIINSNDKLQKCSSASLNRCLHNALSLGLSIDINQFCWLIPYGVEAQLQIGYKGYMHKIKQLSKGVIVDVKLIHKDEILTINQSSDNNGASYKIDNISPFAKDLDIIGAMCYIKYNGYNYIETLNTDDLDLIKSKNITEANNKKWNKKDVSVWQEWYGEMCKKAVIKRACKNHFASEFADIEEFDNKQNISFQDNSKNIKNFNQDKENEIIEEFKSLLEMKKVENADDKLQEFINSDFEKRLEIRQSITNL